MGAGSDGYIQLNIYGTTVQNVQNNLGIFDILKNSGLRFMVLEFPAVYDGDEPQKDNDEKFIYRDKERTVTHVDEQLDNTAHSDILSTAIRSIIKESIHNSISNQLSPEEQLCGDGYMNWINPSSSCGIDDMDVNELSEIYDSSSIMNTYPGQLDIYSNSMNVLMGSMNSFFEKCDIDKCKNISHLNAEEADVDIRSLLADLVDDVSKANENQDSNQEMDDAVSFVSASGLEYYDDNLEEYHDSQYNVSEALHRLERSLSPAILDINTSTAATEAVDIHGNGSVDLSSRRAKEQISEENGLDYYDDKLEEYHDSRAVMGVFDEESVSHDVKPHSIGFNHDQSVPNVNYILEERREPEIVPNVQIDGDRSRSSTGTEDEECERAVPMEISDMKCNCENIRKRAFTKKRRNFVTKGRVRNNICCSFKGCCSVLSLRNTHNCWSRLFLHAERHAIVTCEHCDFTCNSVRMVLHHKKKHSDAVLGNRRLISQQELNSLMEVCFPGELQRRKDI